MLKWGCCTQACSLTLGTAVKISTDLHWGTIYFKLYSLSLGSRGEIHPGCEEMQQRCNRVCWHKACIDLCYLFQCGFRKYSDDWINYTCTHLESKSKANLVSKDLNYTVSIDLSPPASCFSNASWGTVECTAYDYYHGLWVWFFL